MMKRSEYIDQLKAIVKTDKQKWITGAFERAIDAALVALSQDKPLFVDAELMLETGTRKYPLPADAIAFKSTEWGNHPVLEAYDPRFPGVLPRIYTQNSPLGLMLVFSKAPSSKYITAYGSLLTYEYSVPHKLTEELCTVLDEHLELFIIRALAALMSDLITQNVTHPVQLHRGVGNMGSMPNNSTPVVAHQHLMAHYKELLLCSA